VTSRQRPHQARDHGDHDHPAAGASTAGRAGANARQSGGGARVPGAATAWGSPVPAVGRRGRCGPAGGRAVVSGTGG
jgi:hypothetical protein